MNTLSDKEFNEIFKNDSLAYYDKIGIGIPTVDILDLYTGEDMSTIFIFLSPQIYFPEDEYYKYLGYDDKIEHHLMNKHDIPEDLFMDWYIDGEEHFYIMTKKQIKTLSKEFLDKY